MGGSRGDSPAMTARTKRCWKPTRHEPARSPRPRREPLPAVRQLSCRHGALTAGHGRIPFASVGVAAAVAPFAGQGEALVLLGGREGLGVGVAGRGGPAV